MKLKHVHLFGILLLSLVLASFLGKYIDFGREGLENENKETSIETKTTTVHTGGDDDVEGDDETADVIPPNTGRSAESTYGNESTVAGDNTDTPNGVEGFVPDISLFLLGDF
jgi:hypothetical protein